MNEENFQSCIELPISARAMAVLSRAAKRNVQKQHKYILNNTPRYSRQLQTSGERFRSRKSPAYQTGRLGVQSAPPAVNHCRESTTPFLLNDPPKIFIIGASQEGTLSSKEAAEDVQSLEEVEIQYDQSDTERSTLFQVIEESPREVLEEKQIFETPKSAPRDDWAWVQERLASRESVNMRPESALTFTDFLDGLEFQSDEYDTDLEEDFVNAIPEDEDPTGVWHYRQMCRKRGVAPAQQVVHKLTEEEIHFRLNHRCLSDKDTLALASGLGHNTFIKSLNLSNNSLNDKSAKHLSNMLKRNSTICRVDLSRNCLRTDAGSYFADVLQNNSTLTSLCISHNKLGDREALVLCEALRGNLTLKSLDVSHNLFSDKTGQAFAAVLMENSVIDSLNLSWNILGKLASTALGKALKVNGSLRSLDLSWNGLGDEGAALLGRPLRTNTGLKFLSLAVNHIGPFGAERLAAGVCGAKVGRRVKKSHSCLRTLVLDRNPLGRKGLASFLQHLEKSEKLVDLSIREVVLPPDLSASAKSVLNVRSVSVFYEGQPLKEKYDCEMQAATNLLTRILKQMRTSLPTFMESIVPGGGGGAKWEEMRAALFRLGRVSELEVERICQHLRCKGDYPITLRDFANYAPKAPVAPPPKAVRRRSTLKKF